MQNSGQWQHRLLNPSKPSASGISAANGSVAAPSRAQQLNASTSTPTVVRLEDSDASSTHQHGPPKGESAAGAGPKPVLRMKRTGQSLPISSDVYPRPKPVLAPDANKKQPKAAGRAVASDLPKPVVGDVRKGPRPRPTKPVKPAPHQAQNFRALDRSSVSLRALHASSLSEADPDSGQDSDGAIKYEEAYPVAGDDVAEDDDSDPVSSDAESDSGSDSEETVEMTETKIRSLQQQLFRPPDLDPASDDDEADYSSEDDDHASVSAESSSSSSSEPEADETSEVALPTGGALLQVPYPSTVLRLANATRPYTEFIGERGAIVKAAPAIFPDGYTKCPEFKGREWICAIRSCRRCYKTASSLSRHARFAHIRTLLNDNMDGTLSIVGTYTQKDKSGRYSPLVVSKRPFDPNEPPMVHPRLYRKTKGDKVLLGKTTAGSTQTHAKATRRQRPSNTLPSTPGKAAAEPHPSEFKSIEMATKDRPYKFIQTPDGRLQPSCGALIPGKYEEDNTIPGHPYICPIRSCRCVFDKVISLGSHFVRRHWANLLNDNLDGTLSELGTYTSPVSGKTTLPAIVISQKPLDPSEGPLAEPKLPAQSKGDRFPSTLGAAISPQESSVSATITAAGTAAASRGRVGKFWDYLLPFLPEGSSQIPPTPKIHTLLELPRKRLVGWRDDRIKRRLDNHDDQLLGIIVHIVGSTRKGVSPNSGDVMCTNCMSGLGPFPFKGCQTLPGVFSDLADDCCANCLFGDSRATCSIKHPSLLKEVMPVVGEDEVADTQKKRQLSDPEAAEDNLGATTRRSGRLHFSEENAEGTEPRRKMVRLSLSSGQNKIGSGGLGNATATKGTSSGVAASSSSSILRAGQVEPNHFEMEGWEIAPGHIEGTGPEQANSIFFSKSFLEQRQAIQVSPELHVRVETIKSGHISELAAHARNTRYCYVATGKLWVTIDGEPETALGTHGMFKLMPGKKAQVQNRLYFDSVLQVSTFGSQ